MSKTDQELQELKAKFAVLDAEHQWLKQVCKMLFSIADPWMSPAKASPILGWSRDRIMKEIELAEKARALGQRSDVLYGQHYRNDQSPDATEPTWKVNLTEFSKLTTIPPDQRIVPISRAA